MKINLPANWALTTLGEICQKVKSISPSSIFDSTFQYVDITSIDSSIYKVIDAKECLVKDAPSRARQLILASDTLISTVRPYLRKIAFISEEHNGQIASTGFTVVRPKQGVDPKYIFYHTISDEFINSLCEKQRGASYPAVRDSDVFEQEIALPPLAEQHRIVAQLDAFVQKLEASQERLDKLPDLLNRFRQSVLTAAVSGKLTAAWRMGNPGGETSQDLLGHIQARHRAQWEEKQQAKVSFKQLSLNDTWKLKYEELAVLDTSELPELPEGWLWVTPEQIASARKYSLAIGPFGSNLKVPDYRDEGVPLIFVRDIKSGRFGETHPKFVTPEKADELLAHQVEGGDILITKMGEPPGDACLYPEGSPTAIITADCVKWTLSEELDTKNFFVFSINSYLVKAQLGLITRGIAQQKISLGRFRTIGIPFPPLAEQQEIVRQVNHYFSLADQLESRFDQAAAMVEQLPQALLAKAFSGQLVSQDPNDEPASALLERLRAPLATPAAPTKGKRGRKARVATDAPLFE